MTDPVTPEPTPVPPAAPVYAPVATGPKKALSLTSFILGLVSVVLFITTWFAIVVGLAAVVIGFIAKSREPGAPRWMWLIGIIAGFVGIVIGGIVLIVLALLVAAAHSVSNGY
jgi:hypothetical protein